MNLDYAHLTKISRDIVLYTSRKTSNILEGSFSSINRGKSLDFDDLREYVPGDDFHDIDWKSSSRADKLLIRRYVALRKHNILFVMDTGAKMDADTSSGESKTELALLLFGTIAYLTGRQGADFAMMNDSAGGIRISPFRSDTNHLEHLMRKTGECMTEEGLVTLPELLDTAASSLHRRMIIMVITDVAGLSEVTEPVLMRLSVNHDVNFFCLEDAYLTGQKVFDTAVSDYTDRFISRNRALRAMEEELRYNITDAFRTAAKRSRTTLSVLSSRNEIIDSIITSFERRRYEFYG